MSAGLLFVGRETAQMMMSSSPSEETAVKKPPSWPVLRAGEEASWVMEKDGVVCTFQRFTFEPPLLTMRGPSWEK